MIFRAFIPEQARAAKPTDRFHVRASGLNAYGQRQYQITNTGHKLATTYTITFGRATTGRRLAHCTCADFQINLRQCKHLCPAAGLHVAILMAQRAVAAPEAGQAPCGPSFAITKRQSGPFVGAIAI